LQLFDIVLVVVIALWSILVGVEGAGKAIGGKRPVGGAYPDNELAFLVFLRNSSMCSPGLIAKIIPT